MPKSLVGAWATKDKGLTNKIVEGFLRKTLFFGKAELTLGIWTEPSIFAWIMILNRDKPVMALEKEVEKL